MLILVSCGNSEDNTNEDSVNTEDSTVENINDEDSTDNKFSNVELESGTFEGEADGFKPGLKVNIKINDNAITSIEVLEHNEVGEEYYGQPVEEIPSKIIESQNLEVDSVSGATFTSTGIKNAVLDALSKALVEGTLPEEFEYPE
jgi:uncharacterized protein with FMN-binding domain